MAEAQHDELHRSDSHVCPFLLGALAAPTRVAPYRHCAARSGPCHHPHRVNREVAVDSRYELLALPRRHRGDAERAGGRGARRRGARRRARASRRPGAWCCGELGARLPPRHARQPRHGAPRARRPGDVPADPRQRPDRRRDRRGRHRDQRVHAWRWPRARPRCDAALARQRGGRRRGHEARHRHRVARRAPRRRSRRAMAPRRRA